MDQTHWKFGMRLAFTTALLVATGAPAFAVECHSVGGHVNGEPVSGVTRRAELVGNQLHLTGRFEGKASPKRILPCIALASGVLCERAFGPIYISIMTNGRNLIEQGNENETRKETFGIAYSCNGSLMLR